MTHTQHLITLLQLPGFGENDIYDQVANERGSTLRNFQVKIQNAIGLATPLVSGSFGLMPYRKPVTIVIGEPVHCPKVRHAIGTE